MNEKQDKIIVCKDCGKEFILTIGEQNFYEEKGFAEPTRCKECRNKRKTEREQIQNHSEEKTEEEKQNDFEEMLRKFQENTIKFDDIEKKNRKRRNNR